MRVIIEGSVDQWRVRSIDGPEYLSYLNGSPTGVFVSREDPKVAVFPTYRKAANAAADLLHAIVGLSTTDPSFRLPRMFVAEKPEPRPKAIVAPLGSILRARTTRGDFIGYEDRGAFPGRLTFSRRPDETTLVFANSGAGLNDFRYRLTDLGFDVVEEPEPIEVEQLDTCVFPGCTNLRAEGSFVGPLCSPCYHGLRRLGVGTTSAAGRYLKNHETTERERAILADEVAKTRDLVVMEPSTFRFQIGVDPVLATDRKKHDALRHARHLTDEAVNNTPRSE